MQVFVPKNFKSERDTQAVKCSLKANDGLLFPLEKSFIFVHKPTLIIHFADIELVDFQRIFATGQSGLLIVYIWERSSS
jgi:structure-specific recognition protein 1